MMITVYTLDPQNIFIAAVQVDPMDKLPSSCTLTEPPVLSGTEVAQWTGTDWLVSAEHPPLPDSSAEFIQSEFVVPTQQRLDNFAKTRNYDGVLSLCTYASSPNPKFQAEGQYGVEARDATWSKLYEILAEVEAGTRPMPTGYADIEPELPPLVWPN
jgi:hypothetical protein